ncbi:MAG: YbbR-like domain-containing protein [Phycisphaerales bacterium]|nr:YbbR-like domain-containing protein [Phycisphaerales bacterium]
MKWLFGNAHLKVIAFILTLTLYSFVMAEKQTTNVYVVDLLEGDTPPGHVLQQDLPDVNVTVTGPTRVFARLDSRELESLQLRPFRSGQTSYTINSTDFRLPSGLEVVEIRPQVIAVRLERLVDVDLPIQINTRGRPSRGYEVTSRTVSPATIRVTAPESYVEQMDAIFTETVDLTGRTESFEDVVALLTPDRFITYDATVDISVAVQIEPLVEERDLTDLPIRLLGPEPPGLDIAVPDATVSVHVVGPVAAFDRLEAQGIYAGVNMAQVDFSAYAQETLDGAANQPATLEIRGLPDSVEVVQIQPAEVLLVVTAEPLPEPPPLPPPLPVPDGSGDVAPDDGAQDELPDPN